jgi:hypothetical protein
MPPRNRESYQAYRQVCNPTGTVEQQVRKHMEQLYSAYGTLHRQGSPSLTQREHAAGQSWALGPDDMAAEIANYQKAQDNIEQMARSSVPPMQPADTSRPKGFTPCGSSLRSGRWMLGSETPPLGCQVH